MRHFSSGFCHSSALMEQGANINCYYCCSRNQKGKKKINCIIIVGEKGGQAGGDIEPISGYSSHGGLALLTALEKELNRLKHGENGSRSTALIKFEHLVGIKTNADIPFWNSIWYFLWATPHPPNSSYWQEKTKSCRSDVQAQSVPSSNGEIFGVAIFC